MSSAGRRRVRAVGDGVWRVTVEAVTTTYAVLILVVVEAAIRWMPLPRLSGLLGCPVDLSAPGAGAPIGSSHELGRRGRRELRCTQRVADAWPLSQGPCLRRALVAGHLLRRLGTRVRLGTYDQDGELVAHAWLEIGGRPLEQVTRYRSFSHDASAPAEETTT